MCEADTWSEASLLLDTGAHLHSKGDEARLLLWEGEESLAQDAIKIFT